MAKSPFRFEMKRFFVDRAAVLKAVDRVLIRVYTRFGFMVMKEARDKVLKRARFKRNSEMTAEELERFERWRAMFKARATNRKPRRPETNAKPGEPPHIHDPEGGTRRSSSPLRKRIFFGIDTRARSLIVGPEKTRSGNTPEQLENENPFMSVAYNRRRSDLEMLLRA